MEAYLYCDDKLQKQNSLYEALHVSLKGNDIISIVGGGGKTSLMFHLAKEFADLGKKVIVTTSTHIARPLDERLLIAETVQDIADTISKGNIVVAGRITEEGKLKALPQQEIHKLAEYADILLIEADGAKRLPLKVPAEHEPVIIPETNLVIACAGLDSIGTPLIRNCFRWELAVRILKKEGEDLIFHRDLANILSSPLGSKKNVEDREYRIVLNKADDEIRKRDGIKVIQYLPEELGKNCLVTTFKRKEDFIQQGAADL